MADHEKKNDPNATPNIRSPEERYGGEGHAGSDPFAGKTSGKGNRPDPAVEVPDATLEELIEQPGPAPDKVADRPSQPGAHSR